MSGMEDRVSLDISEALSAVETLDQAFGKVATDFQAAIDSALASLDVPATSVEIIADAEQVTPAIDDAISAADTALDVTGDATGITSAIDEAVSNADTTLDVDADVSAAQDAIDSLQGETVDVGVESSGLAEATSGFDALGSSADHAGGSAHGAGEEFALLSVGAKLAAGEVSALGEATKLSGGQIGAAAGAVTAFVVAGKELVSSAISARSAQERYNLVLGDFAEVVDHIDIGGLDTDIGELGIKLGTTAPSIENAASKIFGLGTNSGIAAPKVAEATKEIIALAARAVALNPALGDVGAVAERALTGLARGGRFAANLQLSLSAAEISARALGDTGKSTAADLTIFEKATAGAEIATERLGTALGTDINAGAENIKTQFASIKARFEDALETFGQPLLDPLLSSVTQAEPALEGLAKVFADILTGVLPIVDALAGGLAPALDAIEPVAAALGIALQTVAAVLDAIPGPVKEVAVAFVALNVVTQAVAATQIVAGIARLTFGITNLGAAAGPAAFALAGIGTVLAIIHSQISETEKAVTEFLGGFSATANAAQTFDQLQRSINDTAAAAEREDAAAKKSGDSLLAFAHTGSTRGFADAALGLHSVADAQQNVLDTGRQLATQFHLTDAAALALARGGQAQIDAFKAQADVAKDLTGAEQQAAHATDEFWLAATSGALSSADIAARAAETGATFDDLAKAVENARKPIVDFANDIASSLPGAAAALDALGENEGLNKFLKNLTDNVADSAAFVGNIQTLIERGATDLADIIAQLSKSDPGKAAKLAAEAVKESLGQLNADELKAENANVGRGLVDLAAQNVADELRGGKLDLAFAQTQDAIGAAMLKIPGQVEPDAKKSGEEVAGILSDAVLSGAGLGSLPDAVFNIGKQVSIGLADGIQGQEAEVAFASVQMAKVVTDSVKGFLKISSPSKLFQEIGELTAEGFFIGLSDTQGAADALKPIIDVVDKFKLSAADISKSAGGSIDEITASLQRLGDEQEKLTPDKLIAVGKAVDALGGSKGVKDLQNAIAQQVSAAFGGIGGKEVAEIAEKLRVQAALTRAQLVFGVTPNVPTPFETSVVKGPDSTTPQPQVVVQQDITVTPPDDTTASEMAGAIGTASAWAFAGVVG